MSDTVTLGLDQVKSVAVEVADEFPGRLNADVWYSTPCLVGEILQRLDVPIRDDLDGVRVSRIPWVRVGDITFTAQAIAFLQRIQDRADDGITWGLAVGE